MNDTERLLNRVDAAIEESERALSMYNTQAWNRKRRRKNLGYTW